MLTIRPNTTPNTGDMWADARACGRPANAAAHAVVMGEVSMKHRSQAAAGFGGSYGIRVRHNGTTKRPEGLGGSAG